ncbi:MAG: acyl-CoA dehydrogenase [Candidatus Hydrogenedentota bacterium]|nr:MAG: acyl-CoA dehydrogenase [Candidatus Hydrogenedentota bacterium]
MILSNYYEDNPDLQFTIDHFVNWESFIPKHEKNFSDAKEYQETKNPNLEFAPTSTEEAVENAKLVFQQMGEIAGKELAAVAKEADKQGLKFHDGKVEFPESLLKVLDIIQESGFLAYSCERRYGGLHLSITQEMPLLEMLARGDAAFAIYVGCFNLAAVLERYAQKELIEEYVPKMTSGQYTGAMALTEPDYGSDLPHIRTQAVKGEDGVWRITGTKRFITHACGVGDRPAVILTLARTGGEGAKGLSFFAVESTNVEIARIEDKMGLHTSPTCEVVYDKTPAKLIGEEGKGLVKYAMGMMNGARMGIAIQGVGIAQAALEEAKKYASERIQFGVPIEQIPAVRRLLDEMEAITQSLRALTYHSAEVVDRAESTAKVLEEQGLSEREIRRHPDMGSLEKLAKLFTPVSKLFTSELANEVAYNAMQVFGGSGYTEEYDVAKIYRDARICVIYEGTSQLQVVAAIGGINEGMKEGGWAAEYLKQLISELKDAAVKEKLSAYVNRLIELVKIYKEKTRFEKDTLAWDMVWYFSWLVTYILMHKQKTIAKEKGLSDIVQMKEKALKVYGLRAEREMEAIEYQVKNYQAPQEAVNA